MRLRFTLCGREIWAIEFNDGDEYEPVDYPVGQLDPSDEGGRIVFGGDNADG